MGSSESYLCSIRPLNRHKPRKCLELLKPSAPYYFGMLVMEFCLRGLKLPDSRFRILFLPKDIFCSYQWWYMVSLFCVWHRCWCTDPFAEHSWSFGKVAKDKVEEEESDNNLTAIPSVVHVASGKLVVGLYLRGSRQHILEADTFLLKVIIKCFIMDGSWHACTLHRLNCWTGR